MNANEPKWEKALKEERELVCGDDKTKKARLTGLAFSGGGIRSATFNLGVLEALKSLGLLDKFDYLSTVSGGGYIGAWFSASCHRHKDWRSAAADWSESIRHLRRYSNYLSPSVGFFSADTWSMAMVWLRNTILMQVTVALAIAVALIAPRLLFPAFSNWSTVGHWRWMTIALFVVGVVGIAGNQLRVSRRREDLWILRSDKWWLGLALGAATLVAAWAWQYQMNFDPFPPFPPPPGENNYLAAGPIAALLVLGGFLLLPLAARVAQARQIDYDQRWVQLAVVAPMMIAGLLVAAVLWGDVQPGHKLIELNSFGMLFAGAWRHWPFPLTVVFVSLALLAYCSVRTAKTAFGLLAVALAPTVSIVVLHALLCAIVLLLHDWTPLGPEGAWRAFVWAPVAVIYAFSLTIVALIGMLGRQSTEGAREWWSRLGAWLGIYGTAWMLVALASVYGPHWAAILLSWKGALSGAWIGTTAAGLLAGQSSSTGGKETKRGLADQAKDLAAKVAPFVFIAGLLLLVGSLVHELVQLNAAGIEPGMTYWDQLGKAAAKGEFINWYLMGGSLALLLLFTSRVDINEFSLNAFYRSRLVRCYLGATRPENSRNPQKFTSFDDADDFPLAELVRTPGQAKTGSGAEPSGGSGDAAELVGEPGQAKTAGPFHIVNCALNLGGSSDLTLHTRRSASFTLTPLHCGSRYQSRTAPNSGPEEIGYFPTSIFGSAEGQPTLGQAIAVSGAAASPNMGYHTSPVVAFLLTLFNVRLGWWFPNPARGDVSAPSPWFSLRYLFMELFGLANDRSSYLAISDGGHFENLAAYELVKRRCKVIVIGDGECDRKMEFGGLGTLIRVCEVDFGARIVIDPGSLALSESGWSGGRCAVGRIAYAGDEEPKEGILIYLKASMNGHEGTSIKQYKASHAEFPHESTGDQFYGEDQFESYRLLGGEIAHSTFAPGAPETDLVKIAEKLRNVWSPSLRNGPQFAQNSSRLMDLWADLSARENMSFLDSQLSTNWPHAPAKNFRESFYAGSRLLQLMENVYLELRLEETWSHPDNNGWRELFTVWASAEAVRDAWQRTHATYGIRFAYFCERHLGLARPERSQGAHGG